MRLIIVKRAGGKSDLTDGELDPVPIACHTDLEEFDQFERRGCLADYDLDGWTKDTWR